ncbi:autotransporter domain-containing protein [Bradyrhizobium ontarionense]|uniref:Autotransporter domain-containing protein n=1 Tax=Bradyrhizobium ontarionense TaxID=2898149 RepID=A0ABY3RFE7_9BRAD|nr:autotransporter domain-containing protein [Bradyrhizobium sp. A19]UFZ05512.1 autotransporter domain-containing protein [Bradyrhizobium sp. A19]
MFQVISYFSWGDILKHPLVLAGPCAGFFALLGLIVAPGSARAGCSTGGTVQTCTGNLSAGVAVDPSVNTLLVNTLTTNISPASGTAGISTGQFASDISGTIDLGAFQIITSGAGGVSFLSARSVDLTFKGTISTNGGAGIAASSAGEPSFDVHVRSTGNISTRGVGASGIAAFTSCCGVVTLESTGDISTNGSGAYGLVAQAQAFSSAVTSKGNVTTAGDNSAAIAAFSGGAVTISSQGNLTTSGSNASGITASGNDITINSIGSIVTNGSGSDGIFARSGYFVQHTSIRSNGDITASGDGSYGIHTFTSSLGNTAVTNLAGTISGGQGAGAGVYLQGGTNVLTNYGTITSAAGTAGSAILGDTGNTIVNNSGTIIGSVKLGTGANSFNNLAGAVFAPGASVVLGDGMTLTNSGVLAPGGSTAIQTTNLSGNLILNSGGTYLVKVSPTASDQIVASGTAALSGTVNAVFSPASYVTKRYTILSAAGGLNDTRFSTLVETNLPANFHTALSYTPKDVYLDLILNYGLPGGLNGNQAAVGNTLINAFNSNGIPFVYAGLTANGLTQASGEVGTLPQHTTFDAMGQFLGLLTDPLIQRTTASASSSGPAGFAGDSNAYQADRRTDAFAMFTKAPPVPFAQRWNVWTAGFGGSQSSNGNASVGSNDTTSRIYGAAAGADYLFSPNTLAGFSLAGGGTNFNINGLGSGRSDLFQIGAYMRHTDGPAYVSAALAYGWQDITTDRYVTIAGVDHLRAEFNANAYSGRVEGGYRLIGPWSGGVGIAPYAAAQVTTIALPSYSEQVVSGAGNFALNYAAKSPTDTRSELGFRTDKSFTATNGVLSLRGRLAWAHDFNPDRAAAATFQAVPGASFVVNGAAQARNSALTSAAVEMHWTAGWSAAATFEGEFSDTTRSYAGKAVVRYAW